jgi:hypothetical protein
VRATEDDHRNVQGSMEPPHRRRGHVGARGGLEDGVSRLFRELVRISGVRFILRGVGLSHPKTCEFRKKFKTFNFFVAFMLPCIIFVLLSFLVFESV